jgi:hypothetical protein
MLYCPGYEVSGMENIPDDTPALIVLYHGAIPIDLYYFISKTLLLKNRLVHTVADRFLFKIPGKYEEYDFCTCYNELSFCDLEQGFLTRGAGHRCKGYECDQLKRNHVCKPSS